MTEHVGMDNPAALQYERSYGYESEEAKLIKIGAKVVIAGLGGGGGLLAVMLAAEGYGNISIIDGDTYDASNWRVSYVDEDAIGRKKTEVTGEKILKKNPSVNLRIYDGKFGPDCADDFMLDGTKWGQKIIAIDEIDVTGRGPAAALLFAQTARRHGLPVMSVTDVGRGGGTVTSYDPHSKHTYERVNHLPQGVSFNTMHDSGFMAQNIAYLPAYGSLDAFRTVIDNNAPVAAHPRGALVATGLGMSEAERLVMDGMHLHYPKPTWAPRVRWVDVDGTSGSTRFPTMSTYAHLALGALRDKVLHINPRADYSPQDIARRAAIRDYME